MTIGVPRPRLQYQEARVMPPGSGTDSAPRANQDFAFLFMRSNSTQRRTGQRPRMQVSARCDREGKSHLV